jgi:hypothetical protein
MERVAPVQRISDRSAYGTENFQLDVGCCFFAFIIAYETHIHSPVSLLFRLFLFSVSFSYFFVPLLLSFCSRRGALA